MVLEVPQQCWHVRVLEIVGRLFDLILVKNVSVGHEAQRAVGPYDVVNALDTLQVHREALESVRALARHRSALEAADLLKVGELRDLHAVQPHYPTQAPGSQGG